MRLSQWLSDKTLIKAARDLHANNPIFQQMLAVVEDESPLSNPLAPQGPTADDRSYRLGLIEGYNEALKKLRALWSLPPAQPKPLVPDYKPAE